ncbi:MAG: hypothetical protein WC503_03015 [Candidatus Shapirobacteria bacterium]
MELRISSAGTPYIEFDKDNRIDFRSASKSDTGYNRLFIKACVVTKIMNKQKKVSFVKSIPNFYLTDLTMSPLPNPIKTSNKYFKAKNIRKFKEIVRDHAVDGKIPFNKIGSLREALKDFNVI